MAYDFRANQIRLNRIVSSGSVPIYVYSSGSAADFQGGLNFPTANIGSDVFLFVSGSSTAKTLVGGDIVVSGTINAIGAITASVISGSKTDIPALQQRLPSSGSLLINTPVVISRSLMLFDGPALVNLSTSGGAAFANGSAITVWSGPVGYASGPQGPVFFASPNTSNDSGLVGIVGSLTVSSGSSLSSTQAFSVAQSLTPGAVDIIATGSLEVRGGITGSISGTVGGYPYVAAGPNITTTYNSLGQWEISSSGGVASDYFFSRYANIIEASGSLYLSGALRTTTISASHGAFITGSFVQGVAGNEASGTNSHAEGYQTHALGDAAHSEGNNTIASNSYAHSEGINTTASGLYSHAEGNSSDASDDGAHAEGYNTTASGQYSHSEGYNSIASARGSHGEGEQTFATGVCSHAEGSGSVAYGEYSHAGGENTNAIGNSSQTGGNSTIASGSYQTVFGQYNTRNNTSSLFVVGNGTGDGDAFRHDILRVNSSSVEVSGSLTASAVVAGGVNITPITASLVFGGDGVNRASGSISGLFESGSLMTLGTIGKFDVEILAMDFNLQTGASWKYTATALWPYSGNFSFLAATEIAAEYGPTAGSYNPAADWDVNFNSLGQIELTGSAAAFPSGGTSFYVQVTKKMVATYAGIIA